MEPLFYRLHVKDTKKGGPKGPPRNKMAIHEELCVPSSRLAHGSRVKTPLNSNDNGEMGHAHVGAKKRNISSFLRPLASTTHTTNPRHKSSLPSKSVRFESRHLSNEDGTFSISQGDRQNSSTINRLKRANVFNQDPECQGSSKRMASISSVRDNVLSHESSNSASENNETLKDSGTENLKVIKGNEVTSSLRTDSCIVPYFAENDKQRAEEIVSKSLRARELDCKTGFFISPYDVVLKIGDENFWKTRGILINQQRTLSLQIFELHRIVKVQRSFARSPHEFIGGKTLCLRKGFRQVPNIEELPPKSKNFSFPYDPKRFSTSSTRFNSPPEGLVYLPYTGTCPPNVGFTPRHLYGSGGPHFLNAAYGIPIGLPYLNPTTHEAIEHTLVNEDMSNDGDVKGGTLFLFPMEPTPTQKLELKVPTCDKGGADKERRAIKPVPIDGRRNVESARRIYMTIQEERKKTDVC